MRKMTEAQARARATVFGRQYRVEFRGRHRDPVEKRRFLVIATPRRGRPFGAECFEDELANLRGKSLFVQVLRQSRVLKSAGGKEFTGEFFSQKAARAAQMDARTE